MSFDNVNLWYAKNKDGKIVTINEVDEEAKKKEKYYCPLCGSLVIPRQGASNSWCFAHTSGSECSSESMMHFWCKNELLKKGDKFIVKSDVDKEYICKDILVEQTHNLGENQYRPDLTVLTECGQTIYFEMEYTNVKKLEDYIDIWNGLGNIVVEVDVRTLINSKSNIISTFKAKWYDGKCFNIKSGEDNAYYETIGKYKEWLKNNDDYEKRIVDIEKLDWLWKDIKKYKMGEVDIEHISDLIQSIDDEESKDIVVSILKRSTCNNIIEEYIKFNDNRVLKYLEDTNFKETYHKLSVVTKIHTEVPRKIYDRLFNNGVQISLNMKDDYTNGYNMTTYNLDKIKDLNIKNNKNIIIADRIVSWFNSYVCNYNLLKNTECKQNPQIYNHALCEDKITLKYCSDEVYLDINLNKYKTEQEIIDYILENTYIPKMFNILELNKLDDISLKLKTEYNYDSINLISFIKEGYKFTVSLENKGTLTHIYEFNNLKIDKLDYEDLYSHIFNLIDDNILRVEDALSIVDNINKKYKYGILQNTLLCIEEIPNVRYSRWREGYQYFHFDNFSSSIVPLNLHDYKTKHDFINDINVNTHDEFIFTEDDVSKIDDVYKNIINNFENHIEGRITKLSYFEISIKDYYIPSLDVNILTLNKEQIYNIGYKNLYSHISNIIKIKTEENKVFNSIYMKIKNTYEKLENISIHRQNINANSSRFSNYSIILRGLEDNTTLLFEFEIESIGFYKYKKWNGNNIKKKEFLYDMNKLNSEDMFNFIDQIVKDEITQNNILIQERLLESQRQILLGEERNNKRVDSIMNKIIEILKNNDEKICTYEISYFTDSNYKNGIYFKDYRNKEFILYDSFHYGYGHNIKKDDILIFKEYKNNDNMNFIILNDVDKEREIYLLETIESYKINSQVALKYDIKNVLKNKNIKLSFKNINSSYVPLPRYDFMNAKRELENINEEISDHKRKYKETVNYSKIQTLTEIFNEDINNKINKILYPIIYVASKNNDSNELNLQLNVQFTKNSLNKLEPWLIKDFIDELEILGIKKVRNII